MDIEDKTITKLCKISPDLVPTTMIGRCLKILDDIEDRQRLLRSITKRRPRNEMERRVLLYYASTTGIGGLMFIDMLGGFKDQRPS